MVQEVKFEEMNLSMGPRINKFKFSPDEKSSTKRIFFHPKVWKGYAHYKDGYGQFECLLEKGSCPACEAGIRRDERYGQHVMSYFTDATGKIKTPFGYDVQALIKSSKSYEKVYALYTQYGKDFFSHDFLVSVDSVEFQTMRYNIDLKCEWMLQPNKTDILADLKAKVLEFPLDKIIAPVISLETMKLLVEGKLPNRYATKNQPVASTTGEVASASTATTATASPHVPAATAEIGASKSDLDLLDELSKP